MGHNNPVTKAAYDKRRYAMLREEKLEYARKHRKKLQATKEPTVPKQLSTDPEAVWSRRSYYKHRDEILAKQRQKRAANPDAAKENERRSRERRTGACTDSYLRSYLGIPTELLEVKRQQLLIKRALKERTNA